MLCNLPKKLNQNLNFSCSVAIDASKSVFDVNDFNKETNDKPAQKFAQKPAQNPTTNPAQNPNPRLSIWSKYFLLLKRGHIEVVLSIKSGTNTPNCLTHRKKWTPIQLAAKDGCSEIVKILAGCMDKPNAPGSLNLTPIQV